MSESGKGKTFFSILSAISSSVLFFSSIVTLLFFVGGCIIFATIFKSGSFNLQKAKYPVTKESILLLKLNGIILEKEKFLEDLNHYIENDKIKGVIIRVNSPGGGTASSQEIYTEVLRLKEKYKKPIYFSIGSIGASGAFYISMAGDKIIANKSSILGSIGVIMFLSNLEKLYNWAKIENYVLKTGEFKDSGSTLRPMTNRERDYFQDLMQEFLIHFKEVIVKNRNLSVELVNDIADGRVFTGGSALSQGLIDGTGSYFEALNMLGEQTGLGDRPEVFEPLESLSHWSEYLKSSLASIFNLKAITSSVKPLILQSKLRGRPLYLMPEFVGL